MKNVIAALFFLLLSGIASAQNEIKVYPAHWWAGMKANKIQLMVYKPDGLTTSKTQVVSSSSDIKIGKVHKPENNHYLFIDIEISPAAKPGKKKNNNCQPGFI
jgi:hypothetical protein